MMTAPSSAAAKSMTKRHQHGDKISFRCGLQAVCAFCADEAAMILLIVFFLLITLDTAYESWQVGMRQTGVVIAICSVLGFGGALFSTSPLLFFPLIGVLIFCTLATMQMRKYGVGPYKARAMRRVKR
jgi:hypothetical protein